MSDHAKFAQDQRGKALDGAPDAADLRLTDPRANRARSYRLVKQRNRYPARTQTKRLLAHILRTIDRSSRASWR